MCPGDNWKKIRILQQQDFFLTIESNITGWTSCVVEDRYLYSSEDQKVLYTEAKNLYELATSYRLPYNSAVWIGRKT